MLSYSGIRSLPTVVGCPIFCLGKNEKKWPPALGLLAQGAELAPKGTSAERLPISALSPGGRSTAHPAVCCPFKQLLEVAFSQENAGQNALALGLTVSGHVRLAPRAPPKPVSLPRSAWKSVVTKCAHFCVTDFSSAAGCRQRIRALSLFQKGFEAMPVWTPPSLACGVRVSEHCFRKNLVCAVLSWNCKSGCFLRGKS